jgi:hypothetical protein
MRIGDLRAKGYFEVDLKDAFRRYISRSELDALIAESSAANEPETPKDQAPDNPSSPI